MTDKHRVAILGGGMGSLSAAWRLVRDQRDADRYDITVYQRDHLLGGKGACTRSDDPRYGLRIEEHGIHVLMGWYEEAIGVLHEVYDDLGSGPIDPDNPALGDLPSWDGVLSPRNYATMAEDPATTGSDWKLWTVQFPEREGKPGDDRTPPAVPELIARLLKWISIFGHLTEKELSTGSSRHALSETWVSKLVERIADDLDFSFDGVAASTEAEAAGIVDWLEHHAGLDELDEYADRLFDLAGNFVRDEISITRILPTRLRRLITVFWLAKAVMTGLVKDGIREQADFEKINDQEFSEWLEKHGGMSYLPAEMRHDSPPVRILYDLAFGHDKPFAAGVWVYATLLFALGYKGSFVWKMNGGMGDVVFAPMYAALKRRGVKFRFLHEVEHLAVDDGRISAITINDLGGFGEDYEPLFGAPSDSGRTIPAWPEKPRAEPVPRGSYTLRADQDFDSVVLGISVAGLDPICSELRADNPRFGEMLDHAGHVATQAAQIWLNKSAAETGWPKPSDLVAVYRRPLNSWVDMSHVLPYEDWSLDGDDEPRELIYFCDQAADDETPASVRNTLQAKLAADDTVMPGFVPDMLVDPQNRSGWDRLDAQYWRANVDPSDRYVITPPDSPRYRLAADESGFENLFLAGDWVTTTINAGCLEAAALGGRDAGQALEAYARRGAAGTRPRYVELGWDWVRPQPLALNQSEMYIFPVSARHDRLVQICDMMINEPGRDTSVRARPLFPNTVLMVVARVDEGRSIPEYDDGYLVEREVAFFVPVLLNDGQDERIAALVPFVYVDNPAATVAGREIYGFPKFPARCRKFDDKDFEFEFDSLVLETKAKDSRAVWRPVVQIRTGELSLPGAVLAGGAEELTQRLFEAVADEEPDKSELDGLFGGGLPPINFLRLLFLKQFRDATDPALAAFQQVLTAEVPMRIRDGRFIFNQFDVKIPKYARPNISERLGLPSHFKTRWAAHVSLDFDLRAGESLWSKS